MELLQVLKRGLEQVSGHGGLRGYLRVFFRANDVRVGTLVGEDKYGNKYYEDNKQFFGRHRWVIYTTEMNGKNTFWDVDGSMVPPECTRASHCCGLSRCGAQAPDVQAQRPWLMGPASPRHVGSSRTGAQTHVPCIGRWTLNHYATREALLANILKLT
ncbi:NADH dehydrogenase [ubiquinone] 1 alpha subcomplex subunit 12 isoform X1 [Tursiops truncatus]|uniref:NADH dehydrogenase [ubiquinone] 1 alpha subcomplex subunit 12 isoform X1 n=1 Tax=Tursiops truncatus TaxID=9739 RepID=UPI003CCFBC3E